MAALTLRDYQRAAIDSIYAHFSEHDDNPLVVVPTGGGKSPILTTFITEVLAQWPDQRILCLVHVKELIEQSFQTLLRIWPQAPATIYSAGLGQKNMRGRIVFASIQSIFKKAAQLGHVDLIIVDEAHMIPAEGDGMYRRLLADLQANNPYVKIIGFTATPYRLKSGILTEGDDPLFGRVCYDIGIGELIARGFLCPPVPKAMATKLDVSWVATRGGEFVAKDLQAAVDIDETTAAAVKEIIKYGQSRKAWLVFCAGVQHAFHVRDAIRAHGITAETITGETPPAERAGIIRAYKSGRVRCLTNADVLTTGFDAPATDLLAVLRPTKSTGLWVQIVGRGTRLADGKVDCLVLDFGDNTRRFGPIDMIRGQSKGKGAGEAPVKECPECQSIIFAGLRKCPTCGQEFEFETKIEATAANAPMLSTQVLPPEWVDVTGVRYFRHEKGGGTPSVRVSYQCGLNVHNEWVCPEHTGYARSKFIQWWGKRWSADTGMAIPETVDDAIALSGQLRVPQRIAIRPKDRFVEIVKYDFGGGEC